MRAYQLADRIALLRKNPNGATLLDAGSPEQAQNSNDPAINQFLKGLTKGPLTTPHTSGEQKGRPNLVSDLARTFSERFDVDFF
jgi:ABC-type transporter Mla maintaining outer membrane lipid asymmetry ATPase subunit MlaF